MLFSNFDRMILALKPDTKLRPLWNLFLFAFLFFGFHFLYRLWSGSGYLPVGEYVNEFFAWGSRVLFNQSEFVIKMMKLEYYTEGQTFYITANNGNLTWLEVAPGCTALKQWMTWLFVMLLFPGPLKHKLWFIPLGILVIQLVSVIRISGLAFTLTVAPTRFDFFHDYIFKTIFYGTIFVMWVIWAEVFRSASKASSQID